MLHELESTFRAISTGKRRGTVAGLSRELAAIVARIVRSEFPASQRARADRLESVTVALSWRLAAVVGPPAVYDTAPGHLARK